MPDQDTAATVRARVRAVLDESDDLHAVPPSLAAPLHHERTIGWQKDALERALLCSRRAERDNSDGEAAQAVAHARELFAAIRSDGMHLRGTDRMRARVLLAAAREVGIDL